MTNKEKILELFQSGRTLYFSDIAHELDMDIKQVVILCRELVQEGKIFVQGALLRDNG